ncbi:hypothetical protein [Minwuia sp.]|uniref:hypothetical protein n=1 Tax=Minwuia sp. TaxID=2493630 RepID=UPI003A8ED927
MRRLYSPTSETVFDELPRQLLPRHAFILRQIGNPPDVDTAMHRVVVEKLQDFGFAAIDADHSAGSPDFLARIVSLIRSSGFTIAIFSEDTRPESLANICLELGFASMLGKPVVIAKSVHAIAPSDLVRADIAEYDGRRRKTFERKLLQSFREVEERADFEQIVLSETKNSGQTDFSLLYERLARGFLISGNPYFIDLCDEIVAQHIQKEADLHLTGTANILDEMRIFSGLARKSLSIK